MIFEKVIPKINYCTQDIDNYRAVFPVFIIK